MIVRDGGYRFIHLIRCYVCGNEWLEYGYANYECSVCLANEDIESIEDGYTGVERFFDADVSFLIGMMERAL